MPFDYVAHGVCVSVYAVVVVRVFFYSVYKTTREVAAAASSFLSVAKIETVESNPNALFVNVCVCMYTENQG